jgi:Tol biopolymer transport system component
MPPVPPSTVRVSVASDGAEANDFAHFPDISADGRFVAFSSGASTLVADDTNERADIFVHDRQSAVTTRVSVASDGAQADAGSILSALSADGRFVAFHSDASNLVEDDTNGVPDIFVYDRHDGKTTRVSLSSSGEQAQLGLSYWPAISSDGRFVAFVSEASNLVPADTNDHVDVFVHDRQTGETRRVSVDSDGGQADDFPYVPAPDLYKPSLSADGRLVAFGYSASDLVPGDTNNAGDIFVYDWLTRETKRVSVASDGSQANGSSYAPDISADGRFVAYESDATNLSGPDNGGPWDIFVHDRQTGETARVSLASDPLAAPDASSAWASISADGRYVAFSSEATNLVTGDDNGASDIFVYDRWTGEMDRVSLNTGGDEGNLPSLSPSISANGRYLAFASHAANLVDDDGNQYRDIFVRDRGRE